MRICGIVAEYDPFHAGHEFHIGQARRLSGADAVAVVMSGCFTQRGEPACLQPAARAEMALRGGADLVLLLPAAWAVREAEHFAEAGVLALNALGCDTFSFGAETADLPLLTACANLLEHPTEAFSTALRGWLNAGLSHPGALTLAAADTLPGAERALSRPNSMLAVSYLRAVQRHGLKLLPVPVERTQPHGDTAISGRTASAGAIRRALARGDWASVSAVMPPEAVRILRGEAMAGRVLRPDALDQALLYRLRTMADEEWRALPGCSEGIERRLRAAARTAVTREETLELALAPRYTRARMSRLCAHALLGLTDGALKDLPPCPPLILLGLRESARPILTRLKEQGGHITERAALDRTAAWVKAEERAWDLWALAAGTESGALYSRRVISGL